MSTTTLNEARERIYQEFSDNWGATSVYVFANEKPPDNFPPADVWARVSVQHRASAQESLGDAGARKFERLGSVIVQCFAPLDTGTGSASAGADFLAQTALGIFEGASLDPENVRFVAATVREIGDDGTGYWQTNVEADFRWTEVK